ncbi:hypothetical protein EV191_1036 [Tamaricihabitans halophyticus]|uniref:Uncharacterized protein n=1 Tax=Tamaricihabitans halophyticus TaxID=1262583 RepID=A0A4V6NRD4_9PSEU|nr:hypothetical protein [Tamaricihabitans halophyticus]TCP53966.1 hypothetical protein EV191_1036 [Tamaricihabitans halophyticus]
MGRPTIRKGGKHRKKRVHHRRSFPKRAVVLSLAALAIAAFGSAPVVASQSDTGRLPAGDITPVAATKPPAVGSSISMDLSTDAELTIQNDVLNRKFTGQIELEVTGTEPGQPNAVRLEVRELRMTARDGADGPVDGYGLLEINLDAAAGTAPSELVLVDADEPRWAATLRLDFSLAVEKPFHVPNRIGDLVVYTGSSLRLDAETSEQPPSGEIYELGGAIDLAQQSDPGITVVTINEFRTKASA